MHNPMKKLKMLLRLLNEWYEECCLSQKPLPSTTGYKEIPSQDFGYSKSQESFEE